MYLLCNAQPGRSLSLFDDILPIPKDSINDSTFIAHESLPISVIPFWPPGNPMETAPFRPQPEPRCTAGDCRVIGIHGQGLYLWRGENPEPGLINDIFGPSNPPPRVAAAYELATNPIPSIDPEEQAKIWEGFYRHHSRPVQPNQLLNHTLRTRCKSPNCPVQVDQYVKNLVRSARSHVFILFFFFLANDFERFRKHFSSISTLLSHRFEGHAKSKDCDSQKGAYFHERRQHYVYTATFGFSNPPPEIWAAQERRECGEGTEKEKERDRENIHAFVDHHGLFHGAMPPKGPGRPPKRKRSSGDNTDATDAVTPRNRDYPTEPNNSSADIMDVTDKNKSRGQGRPIKSKNSSVDKSAVKKFIFR